MSNECQIAELKAFLTSEIWIRFGLCLPAVGRVGRNFDIVSNLGW